MGEAASFRSREISDSYNGLLYQAWERRLRGQQYQSILPYTGLSLLQT